MCHVNRVPWTRIVGPGPPCGGEKDISTVVLRRLEGLSRLQKLIFSRRVFVAVFGLCLSRKIMQPTMLARARAINRRRIYSKQTRRYFSLLSLSFWSS